MNTETTTPTTAPDLDHLAAQQRRATAAAVTVVDFDMPMGSMVRFMVRWAIATIPAVLILLMAGFLGSAILAAVAGALLR